MTTIIDVASCKECGSKSLTWFTKNVVFNGVQQNRLNTSDVKCQFVLGCDECGETLKVISADKVAEHLNAGPIAQTEQPDQEPFWYAVVSEQAPTINSAIKRLDVAQEFADSKREHWPDTRVVPLYAAPIAQTAPQPAPEGHEWVLLPIASGSQTEVKADNLKQALTLLDFGLAFALCNTDHGGTRRDVKKAQQHLEEVKTFLATAPQPEHNGLVEPTVAMVQAACAAFRMDVSPMEAMTEALRAALSAQGGEA